MPDKTQNAEGGAGPTGTADYHIHTPLCRHAIGHPLEYVKAAQAAGLAEIGFADHNPMAETLDDWRMKIDELPQYLEMVEQARASGFPIKLGLECDFIQGTERWIERLSTKADWDYLIGSVHYIAPGWDVDNPRYVSRFQEMPVETIWDLYWNHYIACIHSGLFDFVAHPDLPKKFGFKPGGDLRRYYEPAVEALADAGIGFEINTAGWRKEVAEQYPALDFVKLAAKAQIPLLINSDAHAPAEVGFRFDDAKALARQAGYSQLIRFEKRHKSVIPL